ncbi:MAG: metallophosphatase family protein [Thermoplasmata archaeon]|nr:metallophosphatase family protein [Thermoplasmata archaeon]
MRIAFISDVHANLPALLAFLERAKEQKVEKIYCAGDIVGYNPYPAEVVEIFMREKIHAIAGNHDVGVSKGDFTHFNWMAVIAGRWTRGQLSPDHLEYLGSLPEMLRFECFGKRICIHHGSPYDRNEYVYPKDVSQDMLRDADADILILGHTHVQFLLPYGEKAIVNPGSIGQPRDGRWQPGYALLDIDEDSYSTVLLRFDYPVKEVVEKFRGTGLPEFLANRLLEGR